jgi:hypothetical protein
VKFTGFPAVLIGSTWALAALTFINSLITRNDIITIHDDIQRMCGS